MKADFVFIAECGGDPALRPLRGGIGDLPLGQDYDPACAGQFDGGAQSGHARTNHYEVSFGWRALHKRQMLSRWCGLLPQPVMPLGL